MQTAEKNKKILPSLYPSSFQEKRSTSAPVGRRVNGKIVGAWSKTTADCRLSPELSVSVRKNPFRTAGSQRSDLQTAGWSWGNRPDRHRGEGA